LAVNPPPLPELRPVSGVRIATTRAGVRYPDRDDLVLFELPEHASVAAMFTRNRFRAAPVRIAEEALAAARAQGRAPRYLLINTGNANAGTGPAGTTAALACCRALAELAGTETGSVLPFSTGVIGEPLAVDRIVAALPEVFVDLDEAGWVRAAGGILTTDSVPKGACVAVAGGGHVTGIAKGAGMIRPDMATMLAFLATDLAVAPAILDVILKRAVDASFNRITVDGDTSTNDAVVLVAAGRGDPVDDADGARARALEDALREACTQLAQAIVRDGEGATRFVAVEVAGARDAAEALACAYTIAQSPLVKTALFAGDPNWGRILAAVGRAGIDDLDVDGVDLRIADSITGAEVIVAERGGIAAGYREQDGARIMAAQELALRIDLGRGDVSETVWTTDLSHEYVRINAEYRS
jgi:glutamate N-acetyltransferase/amino-acid N-acetyltransferase